MKTLLKTLKIKMGLEPQFPFLEQRRLAPFGGLRTCNYLLVVHK